MFQKWLIDWIFSGRVEIYKKKTLSWIKAFKVRCYEYAFFPKWEKDGLRVIKQIRDGLKTISVILYRIGLLRNYPLPPSFLAEKYEKYCENIQQSNSHAYSLIWDAGMYVLKST